jgi:hypothetical protein
MSDLEIRQQLARFTEGELDARHLEDWLEDVAWELHAEPGRTLVATVLRLEDVPLAVELRTAVR